MARAAVLGRVTWRVGTVVDVRDETPTARTLTIDVPGWPGHLAGQHVDVRLTAPDGYTATRSYSIASAPAGERIAITVEEFPDGEVSPYLVREVLVGDPIELRGPIGGWFVWRPEQTEPVQLIAGGSGIAPLMSMLRSRAAGAGAGAGAAGASAAPMRLLYSARGPESLYYRDELDVAAPSAVHDVPSAVPSAGGDPVEVSYAFTRTAPAGWPRPPARIDARLLADVCWPPASGPTCYVCGPTGFVETVADLLVDAGHDPARIRSERFGPTGGSA